MFSRVDNFLELVDFGSRKKAERFLKPVFAKTKVELNLMTKEGMLTLFDVFTLWENENQLYVFCIEKQDHIQQIQTVIKKLEKQLENENLTLLEKQEQLEMTLKNMDQIVMEHDNLANIGKIASSIAGDLKKPLVSIRGFLQLLKPHLVESGKAHYADIALDEVEHANNLIYQYLSTSNTSLPVKEQVNVHKLLTDVVSGSEKEAVSMGCEINYVRDQILPIMHADPQQLKQVLYNLVKNALDAIELSDQKENGSIVVRTKATKFTVEISITDNGIGMDHETTQKIFTPFYTTKEKGTGIGLALSLKIVKNHGGIIDVSSEIGEGSTFVIVLPLEN